MRAAPAAAEDAASPEELARVIAALRDARAALRARPRADVVARLADVIDAWLAPHSAWRAQAEALLPDATGFSAAMVRYALPTMFAPLRGPALERLLAEAVGDRRGPPLALHILAGNLPGLAVLPAVLSLAIGSAALLKPGGGDRLLPGLFADSIAAHDGALGACLAARYWRGGDRACEAVALAGAELVVASGDDATIDDLRARSYGRFIGHGHRISFAVVTRAIAADARAARAAATQLADDTAIWDQRGCLSPQLGFVEGDFAAAAAFGEQLASALRARAQQLPAARASAGERLAVRRWRDGAEWRQLGGQRLALFTAGGLGDGTVVVESEARFLPSPLGRSLRILPIGGVAELAPLLAPVRGVLECAGLAAPPDQHGAVAAQLAGWGVPRVCGLGEMQRPTLDWRSGGAGVAQWLETHDGR